MACNLDTLINQVVAPFLLCHFPDSAIVQRKAALLAKQWDFWRREMRVKVEVLQRLQQRADVCAKWRW